MIPLIGAGTLQKAPDFLIIAGPIEGGLSTLVAESWVRSAAEQKFHHLDVGITSSVMECGGTFIETPEKSRCNQVDISTSIKQKFDYLDVASPGGKD